MLWSLCSNINVLIFLQVAEMVQRKMGIYPKAKAEFDRAENGNVH